jgi:hypothetical protein
MKRCLFVFLVGLSMLPITGHCWGHGRHWYGNSYGYGWSQGSWYHGVYLSHEGWWWVVGPIWYYYSVPVYPYPSTPAAYYVLTTPPPLSGPPPGADAPKATGGPQAFTYFCEKTQAFFPLVSSCDAKWIVTPVKAPH